MLVRQVPAIRGNSQRHEKLPDAFVKEVVEHTSLSQLIGQHVTLKKSGSSFLGLCPFHGEKHPSFTVSEEKHFYHCFGCGQHGDAIRFLSDFAGMTFRESVTELADRLGMPLPKTDPNQPPPVPVGPLYERLDLAYRFFRHCLKFTDKPKDYLRSRGLTADSLKRYAIGYAPEGWQSLKEAFPDYATDPFLIQAGLVKTKDERRYDAFRDRLIFTIKDPRGRIIGFGGRAFDDTSPPKYLNSPESPVFDKGSVLFGAHEARSAIQAKKQVIVVEGYMDVVIPAQFGIENIVATMGTACTTRQIERLCALAPEIVFTFDGDNAGLTAAWRALETCLPYANETHVFRFCLLDGGMDPDELVQKEGAEAFLKRIDKAMPLSEFFLTRLAQKFNNLSTPEDRAKFLSAGMDLLRRLPHGSNLYRIMRDELSRAANVGVAEVVVMGRRTASLRKRSKDDAFWGNLLEAITFWPSVGVTKVENVVNAMDAEDYAELENERFSCHTEQLFWELFLSLPDMTAEGSPPAVSTTDNSDSIVHRDLVEDIVLVITKHKERTKRTRISAQYRQGLITEDEFISTRQRVA